MKTIRIQKQSNDFFILDKTFLYDKNLSWGAKGLYSYLLSFTTSSEIDDDFLLGLFVNSNEEDRTFFVELDRAGYILNHKLSLEGLMN